MKSLFAAALLFAVAASPALASDETLQVAQKRVQTALNRLTPKDDNAGNAELASALDKIGL